MLKKLKDLAIKFWLTKLMNNGKELSAEQYYVLREKEMNVLLQGIHY